MGDNEDQQLCAHLNIEYKKLRNDDGSFSDSWHCKDCDKAFLPDSNYREKENCLMNLLAVMHRDGGHYTIKHGFEKSTKDAIEIWHKRNA